MSYADSSSRDLPTNEVRRRPSEGTKPDAKLQGAIRNAIKANPNFTDMEIVAEVESQGHKKVTREHVIWVRKNMR